MSLDRNIAVLLREDCIAVAVQFKEGDRYYSYATNIQGLNVGDYVVVVSHAGKPACAKVVNIGELELNADYDYALILHKVDMEANAKLKQELTELKAKVAEGYRANARQGMRNLLLQQVGGDIQHLLGAPVTVEG